jgi:predicted  nucleic acid-binding Zn-ribbon protein
MGELQTDMGNECIRLAKSITFCCKRVEETYCCLHEALTDTRAQLKDANVEIATLKEDVSQLKDATVEIAALKEAVSQLKENKEDEMATLKEEVSQLKKAAGEDSLAAPQPKKPSKFTMLIKGARALTSPARSPSRIAARRSPAVQRRTLASQ